MTRLAAAFALLPTLTAAQTCAPFDFIADRLGARWGEAITAVGIDSQGSAVTVLSNPATGTWTIMVTVPGQPSCMVAAGQSWEAVPYVEPMRGEEG